jgi:GTP-binding protein
VVNKPDLFTDQYQRYLLNRFREELPFSEVPIKLIIRERQRAGLRELLVRGKTKARVEAEAAAAGAVEGEITDEDFAAEMLLGEDDDET